MRTAACTPDSMSHPSCRITSMSFESIADALEGCETPLDATDLRAALRVDDRYTARLTMAVGQFVVDREWDRLGYANPVQWLKHAAGMTGPDAFRMVQEAKKLRRWPALAAAWMAGKITGGQ